MLGAAHQRRLTNVERLLQETQPSNHRDYGRIPPTLEAHPLLLRLQLHDESHHQRF